MYPSIVIALGDPIVGWAKRSVPTKSAARWARRARARLCPPYEWIPSIGAASGRAVTLGDQSRSLFAELGQYLDDPLTAVHDLAEEALAVNVAVLVECRLHQHAGFVLRRNRQAVQGLREQLAVELAHFLGDMLDKVNGGVALDAVVIADIVEALLEAFGELLHGRDGGIDREADVAAYAVGCALSQIDDLLAKQGGLA